MTVKSFYFWSYVSPEVFAYSLQTITNKRPISWEKENPLFRFLAVCILFGSAFSYYLSCSYFQPILIMFYWDVSLLNNFIQLSFKISFEYYNNFWWKNYNYPIIRVFSAVHAKYSIWYSNEYDKPIYKGVSVYVQNCIKAQQQMKTESTVCQIFLMENKIEFYFRRFTTVNKTIKGLQQENILDVMLRKLFSNGWGNRFYRFQ
jgi:hypothetical protein